MQKQICNVLFFIRENRLLKNGKVSVRIRMTVNGERMEWHTGIVVNP